MLAAVTHPSRVLNLDIKAEAFFKPKRYSLPWHKVLNAVVEEQAYIS